MFLMLIFGFRIDRMHDKFKIVGYEENLGTEISLSQGGSRLLSPTHHLPHLSHPSPLSTVGAAPATRQQRKIK